MLKVSSIKIRKNLTENEIFEIAIQKASIEKEDVLSWQIAKKSIDARKKDDVHFLYTIYINVKDEKKYLKRKNNNIEKVKEIIFPTIHKKRNSDIRPVIVGAGPAGLFAALTLVQNGIKPIVIEQGKTVRERQKDIDLFLSSGKLNPLSNVQFGEGGAGTFSDGKLTTGISSPYCRKVLEEFVNYGAPREILYLSKPHIGTDNLINIIENMRNDIIAKGGTFLFQEKVTDFEIEDDRIKAVYCSKRIETDSVILAIGHSSRETFYKLFNKGIQMEAKNFSVGVRIEHLQETINKAQYGDLTKLQLPPADYKLAYHSPSGRSCYTFCMCPGGTVMPSSSEKNTIVTNGMSYFARDGKNANSAVLVNVTPQDFPDKTNPLSGIDFQKTLEERAFILGGSNYYAPVQRFEDFYNNIKSGFIGSIRPSYNPGYNLSNLNDIMPKFVSDTLKEGINYFDTKLHGFAHPDSILTGMETRSSSPVKILRNENMLSNINGIYPCGEGAGYAGGIMSAAVDGIKCAIAAMNKT